MKKILFPLLIVCLVFVSCVSNATVTEPAVPEEPAEVSQSETSSTVQTPVKADGIVGDLADLAARLVPEEAMAPKNNFALLTLSSDDGNTAEEEYLSDALLEAIFNTKLVKIYERDHLQTLLDEQKLQSTGYFDENTATEIGLLAGVDYIAYGTIREAGDEVTINVRVVDVVNGEICAMSRATIQKDSYLKTLVKPAQKESVPVQEDTDQTVVQETSTVTTAQTKKDYTNLWVCTKNRNSFDEYTTYTFTLKGPGDYYLFFGYDKFDDATKSIVRAGVNWSYSSYTYDFKKEDGSVVSKSFNAATWSYEKGWKDNGSGFYFSYNKGESVRFFMNLYMNNNLLTVRQGNTVQRFQTAGFLDALTAAGITLEELDNAIANEEF